MYSYTLNGYLNRQRIWPSGGVFVSPNEHRVKELNSPFSSEKGRPGTHDSGSRLMPVEGATQAPHTLVSAINSSHGEREGEAGHPR